MTKAQKKVLLKIYYNPDCYNSGNYIVSNYREGLSLDVLKREGFVDEVPTDATGRFGRLEMTQKGIIWCESKIR